MSSIFLEKVVFWNKIIPFIKLDTKKLVKIKCVNSTSMDTLLNYGDFMEKTKDKWFNFVYIGSLDFMSRLLEKGIDVNSMYNKKNKKYINLKETALTLAIKKGNEKIVKFLLGCKGINVNLFSSNIMCKFPFKNITALMLACFMGNKNCVKMLLESEEIDINLKDSCGWTALMYAVKKGNEKCVKLLLKYKGIDVNARDMSGETALGIAVNDKKEEILKLLLEYKEIN